MRIFGTLLALDVVAIFAFTFVEPQMAFYFYDDLDWSTVQFGVFLGAHGSAMAFSHVVLGRLSDRLGRMPLIVLDLALTALLYFGLALVTDFVQLLVIAVVAGLGMGLHCPALGAFYLDIMAREHRPRIVGLKDAAGSLGGVGGPLLLVIAAAWSSPQGIFVAGRSRYAHRGAAARRRDGCSRLGRSDAIIRRSVRPALPDPAAFGACVEASLSTEIRLLVSVGPASNVSSTCGLARTPFGPGNVEITSLGLW